MDIEDIPQDDSKIFRGQKKVIYATRNGKFEAGTTTGWNAEEFATQQAVDELAQLTEQALQAVKSGEKSIIYYLMNKNRYDLQTLAQATGFWQWQIKRHFRLDVFNKLSEKKLEVYAGVFGVSIKEIKRKAMKKYEIEFFEAVDRTKNFSLNLPQIEGITTKQYLEDTIFENKLSVFCQEELPTFSVNDISAQCIKIHYDFKKKLEKLFNIPIYYTIGYVQIDDNKMFYNSEESLKELLVQGMLKNTVNIHVWLTLPSMEILDFSFPTTYGKVTGNKNMYGRTIILHPDNLTGGMSYHPMLIGDDFLFKIGAIKFE